MRIVALAALALLSSASESALAMSFFGSASCNKGMLWPYVRAPGDCLTDAEIAAGQRGTYNGPTDANPDVGAIAPPPQPAPNDVPAPAGDPLASIPAPVPMAAPVAGMPAQLPAGTSPGMQTVTEFSCSKGLLWPFRRSAGDCLTAAEKRRGMTGVYGGGTGLVVTQVPAPPPQIVYQQVPQQPVPQVVYPETPQVQPGEQVTYQQVPAPQQPVPQVVYQQTPQVQPGQQMVYQQGPAGAVVDSAGQVVMVQPAPPPQQTAGGCTKGPLWPFIKKPGDCPSSSSRQRR